MAKVSGAVFSYSFLAFLKFCAYRRSWLRKSVRPTLVVIMSIRNPSVSILWPRALDYLLTLLSLASAGSVSEVSDLNPPSRNCLRSLFPFFTFLSCGTCQCPPLTCPWAAFRWSLISSRVVRCQFSFKNPQTVSLSPAHSALNVVSSL